MTPQAHPASQERENPAALPDPELVRLAARDPETRQGRAASVALLSRHRLQVYRWCYRWMQDHESALDLTQEVLLSAYRNLSGFSGRSRFSSWLFAIARNRCISAKRRPTLLVDDECDLNALADPKAGPDAQLEETAETEAVLELLRAHLDPLETKAMCLRCFERMPVMEITRILGITQASGARGVLQSARRKLRAVLADPRAENGGGHGA